MPDLAPDDRVTLLKLHAHFQEGLAMVRALLGADPVELVIEPEYVSLKEAARRLGVKHVDTVKRLCRKYDCGGPPNKGERWLVDITRLMAARRYRGRRSG